VGFYPRDAEMPSAVYVMVLCPSVCQSQTGFLSDERIELTFGTEVYSVPLFRRMLHWGWLGSRVVSVMDSGAKGPGFKSQPRRCRVTVLGKLFTPIVPLFIKQRNW